MAMRGTLARAHLQDSSAGAHVSWYQYDSGRMMRTIEPRVSAMSTTCRSTPHARRSAYELSSLLSPAIPPPLRGRFKQVPPASYRSNRRAESSLGAKRKRLARRHKESQQHGTHLARVRRLRARIVAGARSMRTGQGGAGDGHVAWCRTSKSRSQRS